MPDEPENVNNPLDDPAAFVQRFEPHVAATVELAYDQGNKAVPELAPGNPTTNVSFPINAFAYFETKNRAWLMGWYRNELVEMERGQHALLMYFPPPGNVNAKVYPILRDYFHVPKEHLDRLVAEQAPVFVWVDPDSLLRYLRLDRLAEATDDDPANYLDWLGKKNELGQLCGIQFGAHIHTSDEQMIREHATEAGIDVDSPAFWDEVERCLAIIEAHALQLLREAGLYVQDEGHGADGDRTASVWIFAQPIGEPHTQKQIALLKAILDWADGDWPSTTSGNFDHAFGAGATDKLYALTEAASRFIEVTIEFTGTEALKEWAKLNLVESTDPDVDSPDNILSFEPMDVLLKAGYHSTAHSISDRELVKAWPVDLAGSVYLFVLRYYADLIHFLVRFGDNEESSTVAQTGIRVGENWMNVLIPRIEQFMAGRKGDPKTIADELDAFLRQTLASLKNVAESEEPDVDKPEGYLDRVTGWIDTFVNAGCTLNTENTHRNQFWKKFELPDDSNYWLYLHVRDPLWIIAQRVASRTVMREIFEFPHGDIKGMTSMFERLNTLMTRARTRARNDFYVLDQEIQRMHAEHLKRRDRYLSGKVEEGIDDPPPDLLATLSPEACQHCNNDLTQRHSVVRQYVERGTERIYELSGHYDAAEGFYTNDDKISDALLNALPQCDLPDDCDICQRCGKSTTKDKPRRQESQDVEPPPDPDAPEVNIGRLTANLDFETVMHRLGFTFEGEAWERSGAGLKMRVFPPGSDPTNLNHVSYQLYATDGTGQMRHHFRCHILELEDIARGEGIIESQEVDQPEPEQYLAQIHDINDLIRELVADGTVYVNSIRQWGRWMILSGGDDTAGEDTPPTPEAIRGLLEEFLAAHGITVFHIKLGTSGIGLDRVWFQLGLPKTQIAVSSQHGHSKQPLNFEDDPDSWLPENVDDPDDPTDNINRTADALDVPATMHRLGFEDLFAKGSTNGPAWGWQEGNKRIVVFPTSIAFEYEITLLTRPAAKVQVGRGRRWAQWSATGRLKSNAADLAISIEALRRGQVVEGIADPDDPAVNVERHIEAMDAGKILEPMGFSLRLPSWNCSDKDYKWWEKFDSTTGFKWTVIRKSDDEPQMMDVSVSRSRPLPGHNLRDWQQIGGFHCHIGDLEKKLKRAFTMRWGVEGDDRVWGQNVRALDVVETTATDEPQTMFESKDEENWQEILMVLVGNGRLTPRAAERYKRAQNAESNARLLELFLELDELSQAPETPENNARFAELLGQMVNVVTVANMRYGSALRDLANTVKVVENEEVDPQQFVNATFDVPTMLKRLRFEKNGNEWSKVYRQPPPRKELMLVVSVRGGGTLVDNSNAIFDLVIYSGEGREWNPFNYIWGRTVLQLEPAIRDVEQHIRADTLAQVAG